MLRKYENAIEILEESGRIPIRIVDDGDLLNLISELAKHGFDCKIDETIDHIVIK